MDDPLVIVNAAIDQHTKMIKQMKGVPGVFPISLLLVLNVTWEDLMILVPLISKRLYYRFSACSSPCVKCWNIKLICFMRPCTMS